ncbi:unnamed protein product [Linum tenue]|uniref:Uncharacterized protein n=1 Tax=Linum tenue TaxID=586396 RepID=A0AAV0KGP9_9ROSI|nr:unnamed protein product [Linum tenue]
MYQMSPDPPLPEELPSSCREILIGYSSEMMKLADLLFQLFVRSSGFGKKSFERAGLCSRIARRVPLLSSLSAA